MIKSAVKFTLTWKKGKPLVLQSSSDNLTSLGAFDLSLSIALELLENFD